MTLPYVGNTYKFPCTGGWNCNPNYDLVQPDQMVDVNNVNLDSGGRKPRGGNVRQNGTAITDTPYIMGLFQFIAEGGINYMVDESGNYWVDENGDFLVTGADDLLVGTNGGKIIKNYTTELKTGLALNQYVFFEQFYGKVYITNGVDWPQVWDGVESYTWDMGTPKKCVAALAGAGAGNVNAGVHSYKITFTSASGESSGSPASNTVTTTAGDGRVNLTGIQIGQTGTTARNIYRTEAGGTAYKLVATIADNTTTTYADNVADGSLTTAIPTTNLAFMPSDWATSKPKYFLEHGHGINKRLCAIGVASYPNALYMSAAGTDNFNDANVVKINITGSGQGLMGMIESAGNLLLGSAEYTFILNDADSDTTNWTYSRAIWKGGVGHHKLYCKTPSDLMAMDEFGEIYSVSAAESYGDYKIASIARPAWLHRWIAENVDLTKLDRFHAIYDPILRAVKIFVVLKGDEYPECALVYFIDYGWTKHTFIEPQICSGLNRLALSNWAVFAGSDDGFVRRLETDTLLDDGAIYTTDFTIMPSPTENPRSWKRYDRTWLNVIPKGTETLLVDIDIDNVSLTQQSVTMTGAEDWIQDYPFYWGQVGQRIKQKVSNTLGENWYVSMVMLDLQDLGSNGR